MLFDIYIYIYIYIYERETNDHLFVGCEGLIVMEFDLSLLHLLETISLVVMLCLWVKK